MATDGEGVHEKVMSVLSAVASSQYGMTAQEVQQKTGLNLTTARYHLRRLTKIGVLLHDQHQASPEHDLRGHFATNGNLPGTWRLSLKWLLIIATPHLSTLGMAVEAQREAAKS